jgi:hypothetical protein
MAKTKVSEWDSTASGNTDINGININEGCPPSTINNAIREAMAQVKDLVDGSSGDSLTNSGTLTSSGTLAITGAMTLDAAAGTSGQYLTSAGTGTPTWTTLTIFVSGMIMLWSGSEASIPAGWLLCDGTSSTPDLRNKFVVGASAGTGDTTYPGLSVNATGGSATAVVVSHSHTSGTLTTNSTGNHRHAEGGNSEYGSTDVAATPASPRPTSTGGGGNRYYTEYAGTHSHTISGSTDLYGSSGTNANLPPYYALCYIMKS